MKKRLFAWTMALTLVLSLTACGGSSSGGTRAAERNYAETETAAAADGYYYSDEAPMEDGEYAEGETKGTGETGQSSAYKNAQVKLIRRASVRLETKEFDAAVRGLESLVTELDGYVEESSVNQGGYGSTYRSASYTVRVPSEKYSDFLNRVSNEEYCHLTSKDESTEDVGQQYFDTETRLKTLRTKLERLQALLEQAKHMDDIITLEQAITDTEYEIERYSSTLNRYDSLIGYATFSVTISQVVTISDTDTISFGERLGNSFLGGLERFVEGVQEFLVWLVGHVFGIVLLIVIILLIRFLLRKRKEKREKKLREMGIDPNAPKSYGPWSNKRRVPPAPAAPFGRPSAEHSPVREQAQPTVENAEARQTAESAAAESAEEGADAPEEAEPETPDQP